MLIFNYETSIIKKKDNRINYSFVCLKRGVFLDPNFSNDQDTVEKMKRDEHLYKMEQRARIERLTRPFVFPFEYIWEKFANPLYKFIRYESAQYLKYYIYNIFYILPYRLWIAIKDSFRILLYAYFDMISRYLLSKSNGTPVRYFRMKHMIASVLGYFFIALLLFLFFIGGATILFYWLGDPDITSSMPVHKFVIWLLKYIQKDISDLSEYLANFHKKEGGLYSRLPKTPEEWNELIRQFLILTFEVMRAFCVIFQVLLDFIIDVLKKGK